MLNLNANCGKNFMPTHIVNPVLSGFYPDPSICSANEKYYLVCASFSYFPGLPIFESKDGAKWKQIGNIINRKEQLDFSGEEVSRGLFAPTIRHYNGKFYCICTQVDKLGIFFVTAENPGGPWSNPIPIPKANGIDPSLFFDDDGTSWYVGTRPAPEGCKYEGNWEIWIQKINLENGDLYGESKGIWRGALCDCEWPEGPHIYKFFGKYYLIHAEGGTEYNHAVCVARCDSIDGVWEGKKSNPIFTHRHLGKKAGITKVGHADIFCTVDGKWWMCCLASRPYSNDGEKEKRFCNMGRETFLVPVIWEDGWPVVSYQTGLIENAYTYFGKIVPRGIEDADATFFPVLDDFNSKKLEDYWISLRHQNEDFINCIENIGSLRIYGGESTSSLGFSNMVLRRQTGFSFEASTKLNVLLDEEENSAGMILFQSEKFNYRLQLTRKGKLIILQLVKTQNGEEKIIKEETMTGGQFQVQIVLRIIAEKQRLKFEYGPDERNMYLLEENIDASILSTEIAGGFVGTVVGMFATAKNYKEKKFYADFDWFRYENIGRYWISVS